MRYVYVCVVVFGFRVCAYVMYIHICLQVRIVRERHMIWGTMWLQQYHMQLYLT